MMFDVDFFGFKMNICLCNIIRTCSDY